MDRKIVKQRKALRTSFSKIAAKLDIALQSKNDEDIQVLFEQLRLKYSLIEEKNKVLIDECENKSDIEDDALDEEYEETDKYYATFLKYKFKVSSIEHKVPQPSTPIEQRTFKLPKLYIKPFSGEVKDWLPFWSQFQRIDEDSSVSKCDKFTLLLKSTTPGSRAHELVESYPLSEENYDKVIQALKSRYGREDVLIEVYVRQLLSLIIDNSSSSSKMSLSALFDKLESQLRALESLGVTTDRCASILFPMVESCLPPDVLRAWQRNSRQSSDGNSVYKQTCSVKEQLDSLMLFIQNEVECEESIALASKGFGNQESKNKNMHRTPTRSTDKVPVRSAAGLINSNKEATLRCIFCSEKHATQTCTSASNMSYEDKKRLIIKAGCCFLCLKRNHLAKTCKVKVICDHCSGRHVNSMCFNNSQIATKSTSQPVPEVALSNFYPARSDVYLQTLAVWLKGPSGRYRVRVLFDTGSQRSYVSESTIRLLQYPSLGKETIIHSLFGGVEGPPKNHNVFEVRMSSITNDYACKFRVLDQATITGNISHISDSQLIKDLSDKGIVISDITEGPIDVLIGADVAGKLLTGEKEELPCGLVAVMTSLGWTIMGKMSSEYSNVVASMISINPPITDLWSLDVLGISDPVEKKSEELLEKEVQDFFNKTVKVTEEGRYQVHLPWIDGHPPLPTNYDLTLKRTLNTIRRLKSDGYFEQYDRVLKEWENDNIIEKVTDILEGSGHYLPHRHVIKLNSTTPLRPVFDASAKEKGSPSLNDCLAKGCNLIELIPTLLIRFRLFLIGVTADIKRAFLQVSLQEADREFLRFFWITQDGNIFIYRHARVVFGVKSSPYLLSAVIQDHLKKEKEKIISNKDSPYSMFVIDKLIKSFYVDNCVSSVRSEEELNTFISESQQIMSEACFDLRGWEHTSSSQEAPVPVLGIQWEKAEDSLRLSLSVPNELTEEAVINKRLILSVAQRIFDPIGFSSPVSLLPKLLLQQTWSQKISWDKDITGEIREKFKQWFSQLKLLQGISVPRWLSYSEKCEEISLHTFCDASKLAYASAVFIRIVSPERVSVRLVQAKNRVAPIKPLTIPRLELLAATIGARMGSSILKILSEDLEQKITCYFWTDSSTVLSWIKKEEQWSVFVRNRIKEINLLTERTQWNHIPGHCNPADLVSRGCSIKQLIKSLWWEGPVWLQLPSHQWPVDNNVSPDEDEVASERLKTITQVTCLSSHKDTFLSRLNYFSSYTRILRVIAYCFRFYRNSRKRLLCEQNFDELDSFEIDQAEIVLLRIIQKEVFPTGISDKNLKSLLPFEDERGVIRIRTKVSCRDDAEDFRFPILLPARNIYIERLILETHKRFSHMGTQTLLTHLREKYWILGGRRTIKTVLRQCVPCLRHDVKHLETAPVALPVNRVRDAAPFEITGIDYAGPLYLKDGSKAYICLFTCAIFRAVHLELVSTMSTASFIQALRRFISRRGRPSTLYTDNGSNFVGLENSFEKVDWTEMQKFGANERIKWVFSPPTSPWWGGWWERLVGLLKRLLRRVLGRSSLPFEDLTTVLCDCEAVLNARPLTYVSNSNNDLKPLTPDTFLKENVKTGVPDLDEVDKTYLERRLVKRLQLSQDLRQRFRSEYLGMLRQPVKKNETRKIDVGDVVIISTENRKRMDWPLAVVEELVAGADGEVRLVRLRTANGQLLRPLQRIHPLELSCKQEITSLKQHKLIKDIDFNYEEDDLPDETDKLPDELKDSYDSDVESSKLKSMRNYSKRGRKIKVPSRFLD